MNKEQYINELKNLLEGLDPVEIEDAVRYCEEYFDEASSNGAEDVENDLGTPQQFAQKIRSDVLDTNVPPMPKRTNIKSILKKKRWSWILAAIALLLGLGLLLGFPLYGFYANEEFIEDAIEQKIEESHDGTHGHEIIELDAFENVEYNGFSCSFEIISAGQNKIELRNMEKSDIEIINENGKLTIREKEINEKGKVILYTSENINELKVVQDVGNVEVENVEIGIADIKTKTGNVELDNIRFNKIIVNCEVGNVDLGIPGKQDEYGYQIDNDTGRTEFGLQEYAGSCHISENLDFEKVIQVHCGTGQIEVEFTAK